VYIDRTVPQVSHSLSGVTVVQVIGGGSRRFVTLTHRAQVKRFTADILRILKSQASKQITVVELPAVYSKLAMKPSLTEIGIWFLSCVNYSSRCHI
jgi:hypothetical protein